MGHLNGPQRQVLSLWSYGIILAQTCGLNRVCSRLAAQLGEKEQSLRQRLREWYWESEAKKGKQRREWDCTASFPALVKWVLHYWAQETRQLVLAMDATTLKRVFVVLSISVVYRGCAIPIAWTIRRAEQKGSWRQAWESLFASLQGVVPEDWTVLVLADRGLYAQWLFEIIQSCHWHPFLRINLGGTYRLKGNQTFLPMRNLLSGVNRVWSGAVTCFATNSLEATLLACWGAQYKEPWLIVTDLPPEQASSAWYGMRSWIEAGFKDIKRDGWQWQKTRMSDPARATRFWLALAVATLWTVCAGSEADQNLPVANLQALPPTHIARRTKKSSSRCRILSCFSRGLDVILAALMNRDPLPFGRFFPDPWPLKTYP
jgi:hypothetical protein